MSILNALIAPVSGLLDKIIPDPKARDAAKIELMKLQNSQELELLSTQLSAIVAESASNDPWTSRALPSFLYVMYALLMWSIPMGLIAAVQPQMARRHDPISQWSARTALCLVRHWLSWLHRGPPMGKGQGR